MACQTFPHRKIARAPNGATVNTVPTVFVRFGTYGGRFFMPYAVRYFVLENRTVPYTVRFLVSIWKFSGFDGIVTTICNKSTIITILSIKLRLVAWILMAPDYPYHRVLVAIICPYITFMLVPSHRLTVGYRRQEFFLPHRSINRV
jgi:hypothetical protein